jgi:hypothetical protein
MDMFSGVNHHVPSTLARRRAIVILLAGLLLGRPAGAAAPILRVSDNHRFLVYEDGRPFFYLGDTAWELFHRLKREEVLEYLDDRASKGFTVIQAVAIAELDGDTVPNAYGHLPLVDRDPARPAVKDGPDNDYWDHVDFVVDQAGARGLFIGLLPTWGRYWHDKVKDGQPLFTEANAERYGEWMGRRYRDKAVIWILGGDRNVENDGQKAVIVAMARGLRKGDEGRHLITLHPHGGGGSAKWFQGDSWMDFNLRQNGHGIDYTGHYDQTLADYQRSPLKPIIDGEPIYEGHPVSFNAKSLGYSVGADARRALYWDLFSGACGHTYGHHSVWQMWDASREPINNPLVPWREAIKFPGSGQMIHGRRLIESRPFLTRVPDDSILVTDRVATSVPGAGSRRFVATRDTDGSYAMVYAPVGRPFQVRMDKINGASVKAWWYNPRDGSAKAIGTFSNQGARKFTPPDPGELLDWVLVLDDAARNYPPPGQFKSP